jgi:hypothetical protein
MSASRYLCFRKTYPGRQYSTTNLNTPCLSGALNDAVYVVPLDETETCFKEVLM